MGEHVIEKIDEHALASYWETAGNWFVIVEPRDRWQKTISIFKHGRMLHRQVIFIDITVPELSLLLERVLEAKHAPERLIDLNPAESRHVLMFAKFQELCETKKGITPLQYDIPEGLEAHYEGKSLTELYPEVAKEIFHPEKSKNG